MDGIVCVLYFVYLITMLFTGFYVQKADSSPFNKFAGLFRNVPELIQNCLSFHNE